MYTTPSLSSFSDSNASNDLEAILAELDLQADRVLGSLAVLRGMDKLYAELADENDKWEYATVIQSQVAILEMDLSVVKLDAELVTDEQISDWVEDAAGSVEKDKREGYVTRLWEKLKMLQDKMMETRKRLIDIASD